MRMMKLKKSIEEKNIRHSLHVIDSSIDGKFKLKNYSN